MATTLRRRNYSGRQAPPVDEQVESYIECNFSQLVAAETAITHKKVGVKMFPASRGTPRTFIRCNLMNCDMPAGSIVEDCNTAITTGDVAHGRYVHKGTVRSYEKFLEG